MPSIDVKFLDELHDDYKKFSCFIETGTYNGSTIFSMEPFFTSLHTIEFSEMYFEKTRHQYQGNKINFILGDSGVVLNNLLKQIEEPIIYFLDGHWSGGDTGKSDQLNPLLTELTHINNFSKREGIVIIDDCRLFNSKGEGWENINEKSIVACLEKRVIEFYYLDSYLSKNDRFVIHIKPLVGGGG